MLLRRSIKRPAPLRLRLMAAPAPGTVISPPNGSAHEPGIEVTEAPTAHACHTHGCAL